MQRSARRTPQLPGQLPGGDEAGPGHLPLMGAPRPRPVFPPTVGLPPAPDAARWADSLGPGGHPGHWHGGGL